MRPLIPRLLVAAVVCALFAPSTASAVTVDEIVAMARGGVTDAVILALIDRDKTIFSLEPDQLVALSSQGVSEPVILAMLKSGREEGDRAAQAESDLKTAMYLAERSAGPEVLVVGGAPDAATAAAGGYTPGPYYTVPYYRGGRRGRARIAPPVAPSAMPGFAAPVFVPYPANIPVIPPSNLPVIPPVSRSPTQVQQAPAAKMLCRADVRGANSAFPITTVVECPAVMQRVR